VGVTATQPESGETAPPHGIRCSVVIVTYRRQAVLCDTLRALAPHIDPAATEVLVIDQCPTGPLPADVLATPGLRYVVRGRAGMVPARNHGLRMAAGECVLFLDDDVVPLPGLIESHLAAYHDPTVGGVAGRILDLGQEGTCPAADPRSFDPVRGWAHAQFDHATPGDVMTSRGCNMSFRRDLLLRLGGFDEQIEIFRDDTDMSLRVRGAGYRVRFVPEAALVHLNAPSGGTRGTAAEVSGYWRREVRTYRQLFRHYRDNLYFLLTHFRGRYLWGQLLTAYLSYVGVSRWPWRQVAKNCQFARAFWAALTRRRLRRARPCALSD
jgi:GT2 family glycosyltransferase